MTRLLKSPLPACLFAAAIGSAQAEEALRQALDQQVKANQAAAAAQASIDQLGEQTRRMLDEYRETLRKTEALAAYNAHLKRLVESQGEETRSLQKQVEEIETTRRDIVPLMLRMAEALNRFVQLDRPFLAEERARRMAELNSLMVRADVGDAEKFRRLLEAYQLENQYGKSVEAYRGDLKQGDAPVRSVDFLKVGRVALLYRSLEGDETGVWDQGAKRWQVLPLEYNDPVGRALAVARKESPPELLSVAVQAPEAAR